MKYSPEEIKERAAQRGLSPVEQSQLVNIMASSAIEGYDRLTIDQNIDSFLKGREFTASGGAQRHIEEFNRKLRQKKG
ncbi:MAG: hypothetical protein SFY92_00595 [Verrucomicrobiae bacterium]|nr:hypothetical protein [Verrucomicrobiae bacterium]